MIRFADSYRVPGKVRATWVLLFLNVLAFYVTHFRMNPNTVFFVGSVIPAEFFAPDQLRLAAAQVALGVSPDVLIQSRAPAVVGLFWAMFLHVNLFHLLSNMFFLFMLAPNLEASMGWKRFLLYYFSCGAVGTLCQIFYDMNSPAAIIGASGAISGLLGGYLALFANHDFRLTLGTIRSANYRDTILPFKGLLAMWLLGQAFSFILQLGQNTVNGIAFMTHVGGFLCGLVLAGGRGGGAKRGRFRVFQGGKAGTGPDRDKKTWPPWGQSG